jgi:hypothetical protein
VTGFGDGAAGPGIDGHTVLRLAYALRLGRSAALGVAWAHLWSGRLAGAWVVRTRDALPCSGCEDSVSLVGRWECGMCGYKFDGFAFARCEMCGAVPPFIDCQTCGNSVGNPMLF